MKTWREYYRMSEHKIRRIYVLRALKKSARQKRKKTRTDRYFIIYGVVASLEHVESECKWIVDQLERKSK